jgi:hypothetical protein
VSFIFILLTEPGDSDLRDILGSLFVDLFDLIHQLLGVGKDNHLNTGSRVLLQDLKHPDQGRDDKSACFT